MEALLISVVFFPSRRGLRPPRRVLGTSFFAETYSVTASRTETPASQQGTLSQLQFLYLLGRQSSGCRLGLGQFREGQIWRLLGFLES